MGKGMIFIDSNIWCYFFDESSKEHRKVSLFIEKAIEREEILINTPVVMEVSHFLVKNLGPIAGRKKIDVFLGFPLVIESLDYSSTKNSISMLCEYSHGGIGGRDATILACMKKTGTKKFVTHDSSFKNIEWLDVTDPVK
jgi:predicted nucleic acid-binding protein